MHVGFECLAPTSACVSGGVKMWTASSRPLVRISASEPKTPSIPQARAKASAKAVLVGDGDELDTGDRSRGEGVEFGDVARPHEADAHRFVRRARRNNGSVCEVTWTEPVMPTLSVRE